MTKKHKIKKRSLSSMLIFLFLVICLIIHLMPLGMVILGSLKTYSEVMTNVLSWPQTFSFVNYADVFMKMNYPKAFGNTLFVTVIGVSGIVLLGSMAGYKLSRVKTRFSYILFLLCIMPMMIPFQSFMITLVQIAKKMGFINNLLGLGIIYWGLGAPMAIFLYHGFTKGIPLELEECALLDGCSSWRMFRKIVFPLLKPVTASVIVVNAMWLWNDFLLPLLIIGTSKSGKTLQLSAYTFMGQYKMEWQNIMAAAVLSIIPALIIYLIFQKNIVKGLVAGAVKG